MSPCVHLAKQRMVFGVFFLAPAGLAGNGSHEGSRSCVLQQQGLGSAVAAGGGVVTEHRVFSFMPAGVSFPEGLKHVMFLELGLESLLGRDSLLPWD